MQRAHAGRQSACPLRQEVHAAELVDPFQLWMIAICLYGPSRMLQVHLQLLLLGKRRRVVVDHSEAVLDGSLDNLVICAKFDLEGFWTVDSWNVIDYGEQTVLDHLLQHQHLHATDLSVCSFDEAIQGFSFLHDVLQLNICIRQGRLETGNTQLSL